MLPRISFNQAQHDNIFLALAVQVWTLPPAAAKNSRLLWALTLGSGAALLPSHSREAVWISQYHWFSCHWLRSGTRALKEIQGIWMAQAMSEHGEKEKTEKSGLQCSCVHPCLHPCPSWSALTNAHFRFCGIRYQRNTQRASKIHHSKTPKLQNEWSDRLDRTEQLQHNQKKKRCWS